jgi:hypothetical protein
MKPIIFVGPTLYGDPVLRSETFAWLPPAMRGDVYATAERRPRFIGLIDGCFESGPSVWHKEILWALAHGVHVYGSASMGALRAAELAPFGMIGIGAIYERYRDGRLQDDGDVAVLHAPAELGHRPLTEAMVDFRATIERALAERRISRRTGNVLLEIGKATFFKERTWEEILAQAAKSHVPSAQIEMLKRWLPHKRVELKRRDALKMLAAITRASRRRPKPCRARFAFQETQFWQGLVASNSI